MLDATPPLPRWSATIPLPYEWAYEHLPFFSKAYRPYRIGVVTLLALSGAAAAGSAVLPRRSWPALVMLGIAAYTQPFWAGDKPALRPMEDATVPAVYTRLRDLPDGAVIELPLQYQPLSVANARLQYYQVVHRKPMLNCNQLIRRTDLLGFRDYVASNGFLRILLDVGRSAPPWRFTDADLAALVKQGFRYLVVHRRIPAPAGLDSADVAGADFVGQPFVGLLRSLFGDPAIDDPEAWVFRMPESWPELGRTHTWTGDDVVAPSLTFDYEDLGLPLVVPDGAELAVWSGAAKSVSFWARSETSADPPVVRITGQPDTTLTLEPDTWTWVEVPVTSPDPVAIALAGPGRLKLTHLRVVTR
jgi:hypothetical protein